MPTILVVDDHDMFRQGLIALLQEHKEFEVIGQASSGREAVQLAERLQPDLVIMDVAMNDTNGIETTAEVMEKCPNAKVIAVSMHSDHRFVGGMLGAGASGYLVKSCTFEELHQAIESVMQDRVYLSPAVTGVVVNEYVRRTTGRPAMNLSKMDREVLKLFAEGKSTKEIAGLLDRSVKTIESHRRNLMNKLSVGSIAELTKYAIREGLTTAED